MDYELRRQQFLKAMEKEGFTDREIEHVIHSEHWKRLCNNGFEYEEEDKKQNEEVAESY